MGEDVGHAVVNVPSLFVCRVLQEPPSSRDRYCVDSDAFSIAIRVGAFSQRSLRHRRRLVLDKELERKLHVEQVCCRRE